MRAFLTLFALSLLCGSQGFSQKIKISVPLSTLCNSQQAYIHFTKTGNFNPNDEFILYNLGSNGFRTEINRSKSDSIGVKPTSSSSIVIESSVSKVISDTIQMNVDPYTGLFMRFGTQPICTGFSNKLEIYTGLIAGDQISWTKDNQLISEATSSIYLAGETGIYKSKVKRGACVYEVGGTANVEVGSISKAKLSTLHSPEVCEGFSVNINSQLPDIGNLSMQWLYKGDTLFGANKNNFSATESGAYQLVLQQGSCMSTSDAMTVKIGSLKPSSILSQPISSINGVLTVCDGLNVNLSLSDYQSRNDITFDWLHNGVKIQNKSSNSIFVKEPGFYRYKLKQGDCEVLSEEVLIRNGKMRALDLYSLSGTSTCDGHRVSLFINPKSNAISSNSYNLKLIKDGEFRGDIPFLFDFLRISESGQYHVEGNFGVDNCLIYSDTLAVTISEQEVPFEIYPGIEEIQSCFDSTYIGQNLSLTDLSGSGVRYTWKIDGETINNNNQKALYAKKNGNYSLQIEVDSSCVYQSKPLKVSLNTFSAKITGTALCADNLSTLTIEVGNEKTRAQSWTGNPLFESDLSYQWFLGNDKLGTAKSQTISSSGNYSAEVKRNNCTIKTETFPVQLVEINKLLKPLKDTLGICPNGGSVSIEASEIAQKYQWINDSLNAPSSDFKVVAMQYGQYKVWMEKNGCGAFSKTKTIVSTDEKPSATLTGGETIEIGSSATIEINLTGSGPWTFSTTSGQSFTTTQSPFLWEVAPLQSTVYAITTLSNPCGFGEAFGEANITVLVLGNEEESDQLVIFPNPSSNKIRLELNAISPKTIDYQLFNTRGVLIHKNRLESRNPEIDISKLPYGTYLLKIRLDNKLITRKIIKSE